MTDDELRALVRAAIAQYTAEEAPAASVTPSAVVRRHPSHGRFTGLPTGSDIEGPCLIEPTVPCNHCGYCQSFGN
jgi:hypothetical protein